MTHPHHMLSHVANIPRPQSTVPVIQQSGVQYVAPNYTGHPFPKQGTFVIASHNSASIAASPIHSKTLPVSGDMAEPTVAAMGNPIFKAIPVMADPRLQGSAHARISPESSAGLGNSASAREQALEEKVREMELLLNQKDAEIMDLRATLARAGVKTPSGGAAPSTPAGHKRSGEPKPIVPYNAVEQDDPVDVRLEEFYNNTNSAIQFRRINRGFYRFGETIVEVHIINHKLMARTEDGWNHGKSGPIEKFLAYYENIERQKAGIEPEA
mmetsp:Transcript_31715/g.62302  ORF Transcript_31715/g.62302 Transcript_31715/m.62302 type:complete len:269 (+) Transcript_31715:68-874(+)